MALTKDKKVEILDQLGGLLGSSKLTVMAHYTGTSVKAMQELRSTAKESNTRVMVLKNRLFKMALLSNDALKDVDTGEIKGQLLYAFNAEDEVAPAQVLAAFAKTQDQIKFVGAVNAQGVFLSAEDVKALAALPGKDQLRAQLVGTLAAPLSSFVNVTAGNLRGLINVLNAHAESAS